MFQLSRSGEYAIRAMVYLATRNSDSITSIAEIAQSDGTPETFLRKIVQQLIRAKLLRSIRGVHGGISLARAAKFVSLLDVVEAVEGPIMLNKCLIGPEECNKWKWCPVHTVWSEAQIQLVNTLKGKTIADLASEQKNFNPPGPVSTAKQGAALRVKK
ncbi:MAG: Rrf2 family transcriptional regulator [Ignavibacteriales bacterium]|nr:Rrf2 family transcriptional regulator [Ignavibacteriales bacterium]